MKLGFPKEKHPDELRTALLPADVARYVRLGAEVLVESGIGESILYSDDAYLKEGASVLYDREALYKKSDIILGLRKPQAEDLPKLPPGSIYIGFLDPFQDKNTTQQLANGGVTAFAMELVPRSTRAQKLDAISSQASLAGYSAVILAADRLAKVLPMMTTPSGTIQPSRVFVIGAGVAGLQAIATAKRLGARVDAFDTRAEVADQIKSLGARVVEVPLGETGATKDGYAKALTEAQLTLQREVMAKQCTISDIVITTAQVFGRKAPTIITTAMLEGMKPGSVVVDLAVETGGNVEGVVPGEETELNGVKIIGLLHMPAKTAYHASQMYSANLYYFIEEFWNKSAKSFELRLDDAIVQSCLLTHEGKILRQF